MSFFLLLKIKEDILKNDWKFGTIDFHSIFFSTMEVNGAKQLFGSNRSLINVNDDRIFIFGWSIPLRTYQPVHLEFRDRTWHF